MEKVDGVTIKVIQTLVAVVVLLATVFGVHASISSNYITKEVFKEFKEGTIGAIYQRLESLDNKMDKILERMEDRDVEQER